MACTRGRASPNAQTKLRLFADAAGYCQRPTCNRRLFSDRTGKDYHIAEMAHVFAAADEGPRSSPDLPPEIRGSYDNLILLCPNCHTVIDKAPEDFPDIVILNWKSSHYDRIRELFGLKRYTSRAEVHTQIAPMLRANRLLFERWGPDNDYRENPEAEEAGVWKRKMLSQIIPNNCQILSIIDTNSSLLTDAEAVTLELFRQHVDDLMQRHLEDDETIASRFPEAMNSMFEQTEQN